MDQTAGDFLLQVLIDGALLRFFFLFSIKTHTRTRQNKYRPGSVPVGWRPGGCR